MSQKMLREKKAKRWGCSLVFKKLDQQLGIRKLLQKSFGDLKTDFNVEDALFNLILNRLSKLISSHMA